MQKERLMRAVVYDRYGPPEVLRLAEVEAPTPAADELLVRVHAASVNGSDREGLSGDPLYSRLDGFFRPKHGILGSDIAGTVEAVGADVVDFRPGDEVFGEIPGYRGGFAEYACTRGDTMALKPQGLTFEEAAAIPQAGVIALQGIRTKGRVRAGQRVLVNGGGGSGGVFAIQLAKLEGAEVTGVDRGEKLDFMRSLGADHVIDHTQEDFVRGGPRYDVILDLIASRSVFACARALRRGGAYFFVGGSTAVLAQVLLAGPFVRVLSGRRVRVLAVSPNRDDLLAVAALCEAGAITPAIDRRYPLEEVPEALRYVGEGRAFGKVVIHIG